MIVTTRTRDGERHESARHNVDSIINDVILTVEKTTAQSEISHCRQRKFVFAKLKAIGGDLLDDETVVRKVLIKGAHHIIAISVGIRIQPIHPHSHVSLVVSITRHIQPMTRPTLTVMRRGQKTVDELCPCAGGIIRDKSLHLHKSRRQADEIKISSPNQCTPIRSWGRRPAARFQSRQDKMIHRRERPFQVFYFGQHSLFHRLKSPVVCHLF